MLRTTSKGEGCKCVRCGHATEPYSPGRFVCLPLPATRCRIAYLYPTSCGRAC